MTMTDTRERPILFNGEMVRAILDGGKTQTRRPIKPQPPSGLSGARLDCNGRGVGGAVSDLIGKSPYQIGDLLYIRETWGVGTRPCPRNGWVDGIEYRADVARLLENDLLNLYQIEPPESEPDFYESNQGKGWRPSIHMPKWASRIWLRVTGVHVERVQLISHDDIWAEGIDKEGYYDWLDDIQCIAGFAGARYDKPIDLYQQLWDASYSNSDYSWDKNPYVWVFDFEVDRIL